MATAYSRPAIRVRRAVARDADSLARLCAAAAAEEGRAGAAPDADHIRAYGFGAAPLFDAIVCEEAGALVGHALAYRGYDPRAAGPILILAELYVRPERRRSGLARAMISFLAGRAREQGCQRIHIITGLDDGVAGVFYAAIGAAEVRTAHFLLPRDAMEWLAAENG